MNAPYYLTLLWILPVLCGLAIVSYRRRVRASQRFVTGTLSHVLIPSLSAGRAVVKSFLFMAAAALMIIALSGPRFGIYYEEVQQKGADMFILLDVSRSMEAQDVLPSRLEKAKADCVDLLKVLQGDRVGLIVFAGTPLLKVPLTQDQDFYRNMLADITTRSAPRGGTQMGDAIRLALKSMPPQADRDQAILLITDGEDHQSMPLEAATEAKEKNVHIFTLSIGDNNEGARIPVINNGQITYLKDKEGKEVWSKADEALLKNIAQITGGAYIPGGTKSYDLGAVYENHLSKLSRSEFDIQTRTRYKHQYQWFLAAGMFCLLGFVALNDTRQRDKSSRILIGESR